jgi:hypothetical protein
LQQTPVIYQPGIEDSVGFVIETKEEPCDSEEELEEKVNNDEPVLELEDIPDEEGDSEKENIATNQQTNQQTLIIDLTISDDDDDEDDSDTTEVNTDVPSTVPLTNPTNDVAQTPQPPTKEPPKPALTARIPSPSPPCYYPPNTSKTCTLHPLCYKVKGNTTLSEKY